MKGIWWIHPGKLLLFFLVPVYAFVVFVVPRAWPELVVLKAGWYIRGSYAILGLVVLLGMGAFAMIGGRISIDNRQTGSAVSVHPRLLAAMGTLTVIAYGLWFYPALAHGALPGDRTSMNQVPGITSFTQLGVPFVCCYLSATLVDGTRYSWLVRLQFWLIIVLTLVRVQLWSERLAMIELGAPIAIILFIHHTPQSWFGRVFYRVAGALGPFLGIPALLLVFTVTEFFRSWTVYSQTQSLPLLDFMTSRLVTYYFTALNNGAGMLATADERWPSFDFFNMFEWIYRLPAGIGDTTQELLLRRSEPVAGTFLTRWADEEFNNMSGIFPIVFDVGQVGGVLYFCTLGLVAGILYKSMLNGRALGLMFFAPIYLGCLEVMRIAYINGPRAVLIFAGCTLAYFQLRRAAGRRARHKPVPDVSSAMLRR